MTTDKTIKSKYQPKQTNVTWIDLSGETPVEKHFINGRWVAVSSGGSGGTTDYSRLNNKPSINGIELNGNKTSQDLGVYSKPPTGIPESDLSFDVQQALQKHFKGWYASSSALPANPVVGDYAYVKGATSTDPATIYECTTNGNWSDSGRTADTSNVQTFASGEEVNGVHIINDLTTGGTGDVLSAEQGKVILSNNTLKKEFENISSPSGNMYFGKVLEVGSTYYLVFTNSTAINTSFDVTLRVSTGSASTVTQTIKNFASCPAGDIVVEFTYTDATGQYLRIGSSGIWSNLSNIYIYKTTKSQVKENADDLRTIHERELDPIEIKFMDFGGNLFDKNSDGNESGYYIKQNDGTLRTNKYFLVSHYIHVYPNTNYSCLCYPNLQGADAARVTYYDEHKDFVGYVTGAISDTNKLTFSLPSSACYVRLTVSIAGKDEFMIVAANTYPSTYKGYDWSPNGYFNLTPILQQVLSINPLYLKKVAYNGDSIARGGADTSDYGWSPIIAANNSGTYVSLARGGATITDEMYTSENVKRHCICTGIETLYNNSENPDYIIFEGGTNDADEIGSILNGNTPAKFGSWSEAGYDGPYDKETFCGAVEYMFQKAQQLFPKAKFGFIIAQKMGNGSAGGDYSKEASNRRAYFEVIMKICKKWGVPYINLWDEGWLNPKITSMYDSTLDVDGNIAAHSLYIDGQHLTLEGYQVISSKIEAWMRTL